MRNENEYEQSSNGSRMQYLGFSNLVKARPLQEVLDGNVQDFKELLRSISERVNKSEQATTKDIFAKGPVGQAVFSDTVLIYSLSDDKIGYENVIYVVTHLLAAPIEIPHLRFRIGVSYGEFYHDVQNSIYVGKALIEAHALGKRQKWCGGAFTKSAEERINETDADRGYLTDYEVPVESNKTESHLVINWALAKHDIIKDYGWLERNYLFPLTEQEIKIEHKLRNTENFIWISACSAERIGTV